VKANGLVETADRTSVSNQQIRWAQLYEKRMRRFNVMVVSLAFVSIISVSVVWWLFLK
jgi:hypothetical protein